MCAMCVYVCVQLGPERFRAPELLFNPSLIGLEYASIPQGQPNAAGPSFKLTQR